MIEAMWLYGVVKKTTYFIHEHDLVKRFNTSINVKSQPSRSRSLRSTALRDSSKMDNHRLNGV